MWAYLGKKTHQPPNKTVIIKENTEVSKDDDLSSNMEV